MKFVALVLAAVAVFSGCTSKNKKIENAIYLATVAKIKGMDPAQAQDQYSSNEIVRVYEGLLQFHPFKRPYVLEALLAESMPRVSPNGLEYVFKIRKGVLFQDDAAFPGGKGRELKAQDFVYSIKRIADPKVQSSGWWLFEGRIQGLDEWQETAKKSGKADYDARIAGLEAVDDYTLRFRLKAPYPQFLYALAMPYGSVVAREVVEKYGSEFINHPVGTGPFQVKDYNPNDKIVYVRNPNYWPAKFPGEGAPGDDMSDAGKSLPFVDKVEVRVIVESQPRWLHFMKGDIDTVAIPKDNMKEALTDDRELKPELKAKGVELIKETALDLTYTAMNNESDEIKQFKDKRVRQAISLALDDTESIQLFYNGMATKAQTPVPPGISGHDSSYKNPYRTGDIDKARKLLSEAGFPGGKGFPVINYDTGADTTSRQMADYFVNQMKQIGLQVQVHQNAWPALLEKIKNRKVHMWGIAWGADYPDAENFLQLFYGPNAQPGGMNGSYYKNPNFDRLFERARVMQDSPQRTEMYKQLARMVAEDCPVVFGVHRVAVALRQPWVKNSKYQEFMINSSKYIRIDIEAKKSALGGK